MLVERLETRQLLSTTYLINPAGTPGADPSAVVLTSIAELNTKNLEPGDSVLFKAGQVFNDTIELGPEDAGTADAPVTISSYDGTATITPGADHGLIATNVGGINVVNLNVVGSGQGPVTPDAQPVSRTGIWFLNTASATRIDHVYIDDVDVSGFGRYGILIGTEAGTVKRGFNDVRITNAAVHANQLGGIASLGAFSATATGYAHSNVYVAHCEVFDNPGFAKSANHSGDGIVLSDVDGVTIERSVAYNNGTLNGHAGGPVGIWLWDVTNALVQHNESHHNRTASAADGGGFDFDGGVTHSVMQYNYSHDNDGAGYGVYQFSGARPTHDLVVRYNISANDGRRNNYGGIDFWNAGSASALADVDVYNNTVYTTPSTKTVTTVSRRGVVTTSTVVAGEPRGLRINSATTNVSIRNNVFQTTGGVQLAQVDARQTNTQIQGNDWFASGAAPSFKTTGKIYASLSAWAAGTGYEKLGGAAVGKAVDPALAGPIVTTDPVTGKPSAPTVGIDLIGQMESRLGAFKLTASSALRDAGLNLWFRFAISAGPRDFYGTALPADGSGGATSFLYDIGAHEYA